VSLQPTNRIVSIIVVIVVVVAIAGTGALGYFIGASSKTTVSVTTTAPITFNYSSMPSEFATRNYSVTMDQGTGYAIPRGNGGVYEYLGFYTEFNILWNGGMQTVPFFWGTPYGASTSHPPYDGMCYSEHQTPIGCPYSATAFGGDVSIVWFEQNSTSTIYVTFTFK
jgi:hypothetical protein